MLSKARAVIHLPNIDLASDATAFAWGVSLSGYRLKDGRIEAIGRQLRAYNPGAVPAIHRHFARRVVDEEHVLRWTLEFGLLGISGNGPLIRSERLDAIISAAQELSFTLHQAGAGDQGQPTLDMVLRTRVRITQRLGWGGAPQ